MALQSDEIAALVAECSPLVEGALVENVHQGDEHTLLLTLFERAAGKLFLLFSTRPRLCRFHLVEKRPVASSAPPPFCETVRACLKGSRVSCLRQVSGDRVVELLVRRKAGGEGAEAFSLVLEMIGPRGQLVLIGEDRSLLASLHPCRRGSKELAVGDGYRFPEPRAASAAAKALGQSPWRYLDATAAEDDAVPARAPLHYAMARRYARVEEAEILREKREALRSLLRREVSRRDALGPKLREALAGAEAGVENLQKGELLKGAFGDLQRGMTSIELDDYFDPALAKIRIELDPARGPKENVERYFKRYQKSKRAVPILRDRLARMEAERARALALLERLERAGSLEVVLQLEADAKGMPVKRRAVRAKGPAATPAQGPRRFVSLDGFEILVGRNARKNDELTLRLARGNDIFLHVAGRPGGHVIVRSRPGKQVPLESLLDAAQLALYYSLPERQRGAAGYGAAADVDYTPVKHVRKPRGAKPGLVLLSTHKTLRVRLEEERLERLRRGDARESDPGHD